MVLSRKDRLSGCVNCRKINPARREYCESFSIVFGSFEARKAQNRSRNSGQRDFAVPSMLLCNMREEYEDIS